MYTRRATLAHEMDTELRTEHDTLLADVHQYREAHTKEFDFNLRALFEDLVRAQKKSNRPIVSFPPKKAGGESTT